jgi:hypothetical protein
VVLQKRERIHKLDKALLAMTLGYATQDRDARRLRAAKLITGACRHNERELTSRRRAAGARWRWAGGGHPRLYAPFTVGAWFARPTYPRVLPRAYDPSHPAPRGVAFARRPIVRGGLQRPSTPAQRTPGLGGGGRPP